MSIGQDPGEIALVHPRLIRRGWEDVAAAARKEEECYLENHSHISSGTYAQSWEGMPEDMGVFGEHPTAVLIACP